MNIDAVERLIGLFARYNLTELDYAEGATKLRISRQGGGPVAEAGLSERGTDAPAAPPQTETPQAGFTEAPSSTEHLLCAGTAGTFFRAPAPGEAPFISEGDRIEEGQTLAILEAMKMLNPVEADRAGLILRILVGDGVSVVAGTALFAIGRTD